MQSHVFVILKPGSRNRKTCKAGRQVRFVKISNTRLNEKPQKKNEAEDD